MKVTIHQPYYLAYLGTIHKILQCDVFVAYDTAQFVKDRFDNRNYIKFNGKKTLLSVPVTKKSSFKPLHEVEIASGKWKKNHWKTIQQAYAKAPYIDHFAPVLQAFYEKNHTSLSELNIELLELILSYLGWEGKLVRTSELGIDTEKKSTDAIVTILQAVHATSYLAGPSSKKYLKEEQLTDAGIEIEYTNFTHPEYEQIGEEFVPYLGAIDLLLNAGPDSRDILFGSQKTVPNIPD